MGPERAAPPTAVNLDETARRSLFKLYIGFLRVGTTLESGLIIGDNVFAIMGDVIVAWIWLAYLPFSLELNSPLSLLY